MWGRFQRFLKKLAHAEDIVLTPITISPGVKGALKAYVDQGGILGWVRRGFKRDRSVPEPTNAAETPPIDIPTHLHTNGCGDFTLMSLEDWLDLRGYPEFDMYSMHLDSVLCYSAHNCGIVEEVLEAPMRIYHIEHSAGSGWTPEDRPSIWEACREVSHGSNTQICWSGRNKCTGCGAR